MAPKIPDDRKDARLVVDGQVATPLNWTLQEVFDEGMEDFTATFVNSVGTTKTSNFTGVRVQTILDSVDVNTSGEILEVEASDGYRATIFLSDVTTTTYLALKEEGQWQNLSDAGALRLVDTHMGSVYWVKQVVAIHLRQSASLKLSGHIYYRQPYTDQNITAAYIYAHGSNYTWLDGAKTRTGRGMPMVEIYKNLNFTTIMLELFVPGKERIVYEAFIPNNSSIITRPSDFLVIDSMGRFVFLSNFQTLAVGLVEIRALTGIYVHGEVETEMDITATDLATLPQRPANYSSVQSAGPSLDAVIGLAGLDANATHVHVWPGGASPLEIDVGDLANYTVVEMRNPWIENAFPDPSLILVPLNPFPSLGWCIIDSIEVMSS